MSECLFPHSFCLTATLSALREERIKGLLPLFARTQVGPAAARASRKLRFNAVMFMWRQTDEW
ncbi:hypothetical protein HK19_09135 [Acetobacter persici]|nr:hypothetical protein HK19_09135 [Acetobacter persici]